MEFGLTCSSLFIEELKTLSHSYSLTEDDHHFKKVLVKRIIYRAMYRGGKEADHIFKNFVAQFIDNFSDQALHDLDQLLQEDDSLIFGWLADIEDIPKSFDTPVLQQLRQYFNTLRYN